MNNKNITYTLQFKRIDLSNDCQMFQNNTQQRRKFEYFRSSNEMEYNTSTNTHINVLCNDVARIYHNCEWMKTTAK